MILKRKEPEFPIIDEGNKLVDWAKENPKKAIIVGTITVISGIIAIGLGLHYLNKK